MQTRSWEGKDGEKKYRTEIVADRIQFGSRSSGSSTTAGAPKDIQADEGPKDTATAGAIEYPEEEINPDDIPF